MTDEERREWIKHWKGKYKIVGWCNDSDPDSFGWVVDGCNVKCSDLDKCRDWNSVIRFLPDEMVAIIKSEWDGWQPVGNCCSDFMCEFN